MLESELPYALRRDEKRGNKGTIEFDIKWFNKKV